jgi:signal transduction histidine kinase
VNEEQRTSDALAALGLATGGIAHDLNNALTAILGNVELMREMAETDLDDDAMAQWVRCFDSIDDVANRLALLTKQLMFLGRAPVRGTDCIAVREILLRLSLALRTARFGKMTPELDPPPDAVSVRVDTDSLVGFLANLVLSVRQAFGGPMTVRLGGAETLVQDEGAAVNPLPPGRYAELSIELEGVALDGTDLDRLFELGSLDQIPSLRNVLTFPAAFALLRRLGGRLVVQRRLERLVFQVYFPAVLDPTATP